MCDLYIKRRISLSDRPLLIGAGPVGLGAVMKLFERTDMTIYKYATVGGRRIFYRQAGEKDAPTIVMLHGFPSSSHMFRDLSAVSRTLPSGRPRFSRIWPVGHARTPAHRFSGNFQEWKTGRKALWKVRGLHQSPAQLWIYVLRVRSPDKVNIKSTTLAFTG